MATSRHCADPVHLRLDRGHDRGVGVPAEHRQVRGVEVQVSEPVDISEAWAVPVVDVDRLVGPPAPGREMCSFPDGIVESRAKSMV